MDKIKIHTNNVASSVLFYIEMCHTSDYNISTNAFKCSRSKTVRESRSGHVTICITAEIPLIYIKEKG